MQKKRICNQLSVDNNQIKVKACGAKEFLNKHLTLDFLGGLFPQEEELIEELEYPSEARVN